MEETRNLNKILSKSPKGKDNFEDLSVDGRIILN
jgi:hypothetical protein